MKITIELEDAAENGIDFRMAFDPELREGMKDTNAIIMADRLIKEFTRTVEEWKKLPLDSAQADAPPANETATPRKANP